MCISQVQFQPLLEVVLESCPMGKNKLPEHGQGFEGFLCSVTQKG